MRPVERPAKNVSSLKKTINLNLLDVNNYFQKEEEARNHWLPIQRTRLFPKSVQVTDADVWAEPTLKI
jgi:hypothetical protein